MVSRLDSFSPAAYGGGAMGQSRYDVHTEGRFGKYLQVCGQTVLVLRKEREGREQKVQSFADVICGLSRRAAGGVKLYARGSVVLRPSG